MHIIWVFIHKNTHFTKKVIAFPCEVVYIM